MAESIKVGIIGAGWPGQAHANGYRSAGGFKIAAVADLIPDRRKRLMAEFSIPREYASADDLLADKEIQAVSVCLPNHLHAPVAIAALRAGKHVVCETPPALDAKEARRMETSAQRDGRTLLYGLQRRYGPSEQAAAQTIAKGYAGEIYHVRAAWTRTRGVPAGTGWYADKARSGGGAMIDLGAHMLDLAWMLLGQPKPLSAYAATHRRIGGQEKRAGGKPAAARSGVRSAAGKLATAIAGGTKNPPSKPESTGSADDTGVNAAGDDGTFDVEDAGFAILRFAGDKSIELSASWALNQPPAGNGTLCRAYGDAGAIEVYTPEGAVLYRQFSAEGDARKVPLKAPKVVHQHALMRHFRQCIHGAENPSPGPADGVTLMEMLDAIYKSAASGKSAAI